MHPGYKARIVHGLVCVEKILEAVITETTVLFLSSGRIYFLGEQTLLPICFRILVCSVCGSSH